MKILAVYDGTLNAKDVLRYGLFRARTTGGQLTLFYVLHTSAFVEYEGATAEDAAKQELETHLQDARQIIADAGRGMKVTLVTVDGEPDKEIASYVNEEGIDLALVPQRYSYIGKKVPCRVSVVPRDFSMFKILLVDDEVAFTMTLAQRLNLRNLKTDIVYNGEDALAYVKKENPDIMILDLRMPGMDGIEVLKQVQTTHPNLQVIILSGRESEKDREEARKLGAFDFVNKPADIDSLAGKIKEAYWTKVETPVVDISKEPRF